MSTSLFEFVEKKSKLQIFLDRYQFILSILATFIFFSDLPDYLFSAPLLPLPPGVWVWTFVVLSLPLIKKLADMPKPVVLWIVFYLLITVLSLATLGSDTYAQRELNLRLSSIIFLCMMYILYNQPSSKHIKYVLIAVVLMSVGNTLFELVNPRVFSELNVGRPGGFYINPNKAGCAMVLGLIFTVDVIKKPFRWLYILFIFVGIAATFSRGSLLGWTLCALFLTLARFLSDKRRTVFISAFSLIIALVLLNPLQTVAGYFQGSTDGGTWDVLDRLEQFQNPSLEDDSARERKAVVGYAWLLFGERPFWGNGLASTHKWTVSEVSTHNMYLFYMADHGIVGAMILPSAIVAVIWRNRGEPGVKILCFAVFVALWGVFSHNVLEERYILMCFSFLAAMNANEKWYLKYERGNSFALPQSPERSKLILPPARKQQAIGSSTNPRILPPPRK